MGCCRKTMETSCAGLNRPRRGTRRGITQLHRPAKSKLKRYFRGMNRVCPRAVWARGYFYARICRICALLCAAFGLRAASGLQKRGAEKAGVRLFMTQNKTEVKKMDEGSGSRSKYARCVFRAKKTRKVRLFALS